MLTDRTQPRLALVFVGLVLVSSVAADSPRFSLSRFSPDGSRGRAALLGSDIASPAAIASEVARRGFYADEPLSATECTGCHREIAAQWSQSAHRFSSFNNPYYAASVDMFRTQRPLPATRFCAGCHDPLLLVDDAISQPQLHRDALAAQAGLPCLICHSIHEERPGSHQGNLGNGGYALDLRPVPPPRSASEASGDLQAAATEKSPHGQRLRPALLGRPDLCASCHRVALTADITHDQWLRGQDDYGPWLASVAAGNGVAATYRPESEHGDGKVPVKRCQDCHMPLEKLKSGQLVRSHRFLAANTALPSLREDPEAQARTAEFLRDAVTVDVLVLPPDGNASSDDSPPPIAAERIPLPRSQRQLRFDVVLRNRRVGHRFPGGTNDSNEVWVEVQLTAHKPNGQTESIGDRTHLLRAQAVDESGEPLLRRDPQNMRAVVYNTSLGPADPQVVRYVAELGELPATASASTLELVATLRYRKFTLDYAAFACASLPPTVDAATRARCLNPPTVDMAVARRTLVLGDRAAAAPPVAADWQRYLDHGLGLSDGLVDEASAARPSLLRAAALAPQRPEPQLGLARLALALGRTDDVLAAGARAESLRKDHPAHLWLRGQALYRTYRFHEARPFFERAALLVPQDPNLLAMLARTRGLDGDPTAALAAADRLLAIEPESEDGHHQRMLALRELGRTAEAAQAEARYLLHRRPVERDQELRQHFRSRHPERDQEDVPAHTHILRRAPTGSAI